jgi:hypothetical protein
VSTPYQSPIAVHDSDRPRLPLWENLLSIVVAASAAAYAVVCAIHILTLQSFLGLANRLIADNPPSPTTLQSSLDLNRHLDLAVTILFWGMYLLFIGWMISLNSRFRDAGRGRVLRSLLAWKVWRIGVVISFVIVILLRTNTTDSISGDITNIHHAMIYLGLRAIIGALYVWCVFGMRQAALSLRTVPSQPTWPPADPATTL